MSWSAKNDDPPFNHDHPLLGPIIKLGYAAFVKPAIWIRKGVEDIRGDPPAYYHRRHQRVPTIDECLMKDVVCRYEANLQFRRDKQVESNIIILLRSRFEDCVFYEKGTGPRAWQPHHLGPTVSVLEGSDSPCRAIMLTMEKAMENYYIKYGELGAFPKAEGAYMKQKHRMMWERRHGPVGTGMKSDEPAAPVDSE